MKNKLKFLKIGILSTVLAAGVGFTIYQTNAPKKVEAAQFLDDYDAYVYSGHYYDSINFSASQGMDGALRRSLTSLIKPEAYYSYSGTGNSTISYALQYADEDPNNPNNMIYLYTRNSVAKNAASSWNREHVWCQSLSNNNWGKSQGGTDVLHLRPTYQSTNSSRGNTPYGEVTKNSSNKKEYLGMTYGYCENANDVFMPLDQVKGDVARTVMYLWVTYNNTTKPLNILSVFESYDTLLRWHTLDRPDELEGNRNDWVETESKQKNRNPFVDHPELAWKIFGDQASASVKSTCMQAYPEDGGVDPVDPTGITINKTSAELSVGGKLQLNATLQPNGATGSISWLTSNSSVATVNNGLVTAIGAGSAIITAKYSNFIKTECSITVTQTSTGEDEGEFEMASSISVGDTVYLGCDSDSAQYNGPSGTGSDAVGTYVSYEEQPSYSICPLEVHAGNTNNSYAFEIKSGSYNGKYLAFSGTKNSLKVSSDIADESSWTVSFDSDKNATITNVDSDNRVIWWNHSSPRFACYTGKSASTGFKNVQLWKMTTAPVVTYDLQDSLDQINSVVSIHGTETNNSSDLNTYSVICSELGYSNGEDVVNVQIGNVSLALSKGTGTIPSRYYDSGTNIRIYGGNTMTFSSTEAITDIIFAVSSSYSTNVLDSDVGEINTNGWSGRANEVVISNTTTSQFRFSAITVKCGYQEITVNTVSLRFGAEMPKTAWEEIAEHCTINDYGVMLVKKNTLESVYHMDSIEQAFEEELALAAVSMGSGDAPFENGDNYVFKANVNVSNYTTEFVAAPFIVVDDEYHFLTQMTESARHLAGEYLDNDLDCELSEDALKIIAGRQ